MKCSRSPGWLSSLYYSSQVQNELVRVGLWSQLYEVSVVLEELCHCWFSQPGDSETPTGLFTRQEEHHNISAASNSIVYNLEVFYGPFLFNNNSTQVSWELKPCQQL